MNEEELNRMLHTWKPGVDLPPSFQSEVWRRIESARSVHTAPAKWIERFLNWIAEPLPATAACMLAITAGLLAGGMSGGAPAVSGAAAYANAINPLAALVSR